MGRTPAERGTTAARPGRDRRRSPETEGQTGANCSRDPTAAAATTTVIATAAGGADPGNQSATADGRHATLSTSPAKPAGLELARWLKLDDRGAADGALDL